MIAGKIGEMHNRHYLQVHKSSRVQQTGNPATDVEAVAVYFVQTRKLYEAVPLG